MMSRACCRASQVHIPTASKTQRSSVVDVLDMFSNSQGAPHKVTKAWTAKYQFGRRCRFGADNWGQVNRIWMEHHEWQMVRCFLVIFDIATSVNFYTPMRALHLGITPSHAGKVQLLQSAVNHIQYMAVLPTWCYMFRATNMKNSSHQGKTYKL